VVDVSGARSGGNREAGWRATENNRAIYSDIGKPNSGASAEAHGNVSTTKAKKKNAVMPMDTAVVEELVARAVVEDEPRRRDKRQAVIG
jgi:hypothetical protein